MDAGKLTITGGTFTGGDSTDALNTMGGSSNSGNIQISGGTLNGDIVLGAASNSAAGTLAISGSAVVNGSVTNTKKDNVTISGGSVAGEVPTAATAAPPLPEERLLRSRPTNISAAPARLPSTRLPAGRLPIISAKNPSIRRPRMRKAAAPLRF